MNTEMVKQLLVWYNLNKRDLPWRHTKNPYCIWVSEIMLQQTRVEAVKGYYERFLRALPDVQALSMCPEDRLLKFWEGLGYYNRVRNMQKAAVRIVEDFDGKFPDTYEEIRKLPGIGSYTAGAIGSISFGLNEPAVDGNVLRVMARLENSEDDILEIKTKKRVSEKIKEVLLLSSKTLKDWDPGDFNQSLIELGAVVCLPNGKPKCEECPLMPGCTACAKQTTDHIPVRIRKTKRKIEKKTVLLVRDGTKTAVRKRPDNGLLAGLYEFPNLPGEADEETVLKEVENHGLVPLQIRKIRNAKHLFSHVEWQMTGYEIRVAEEEGAKDDWIFAETSEMEKRYAVPSAFSAYAAILTMKMGKQAKFKDIEKGSRE
jgi:A/G-specific adenine glycosylase